MSCSKDENVKFGLESETSRGGNNRHGMFLFECASSEQGITRERAAQAFEALRAQAKANGMSDMTLKEINEEISLTRSDIKQRMSIVESEAKTHIYSHLAKSADDVKSGRVENADEVFASTGEELDVKI